MITIIINEAPYIGNDKAWNALRLSLNLLKNGSSVNIFLIDKAIDVGKSNHLVPDGEANLELMVGEILGMGAIIAGCKTCITRCSVKRDPLIDGVLEGSMDKLREWVVESDKVISF